MINKFANIDVQRNSQIPISAQKFSPTSHLPNSTNTPVFDVLNSNRLKHLEFQRVEEL